MSDNRAVGVFDSGLGGLTCVSRLKDILPHENLIYFGDNARVPYGSRSKETIIEYAKQDVAFVKRHDVKMIIAACGTVSSAVTGMKNFGGDTPFTGVVLPSAAAALRSTKNGIIGVIGTSATIASGAYEKAVKEISPATRTVNTACPLFVPLVENGITDKEDIIVKEAVRRYLYDIKCSGADTLIMGCTHYPHLTEAISEYLGEGVELISSGAAAAEYAKELMEENGLLTDSRAEGELICYTTDSAELFDENAGKFLEKSIKYRVDKISVEELYI